MFQLFRCRNLALNRVFSYFFLVEGMFLYLGGGWMPPHLYTPCTFIHPLYIHMPPICLYAPRGVHNPQGPHALCSCMVLEHCMLWRGVFWLNVYWDTPPLFGGASSLITPPTLHCWFSVHFYSQGYQFLCGPFPFYGRVWGCSPLHWGGWGAHQLFSCSHAHSYKFFL